MDNRSSSCGALTDMPDEDLREKVEVISSSAPQTDLMMIEIICERAHCVIYEYAIVTVKFIADEFKGRVRVKPVVRRGSKKNVDRYLELCRMNKQHLSVPAILMDGDLVFTYVPGPEELRNKITLKLEEFEMKRSQYDGTNSYSSKIEHEKGEL